MGTTLHDLKPPAGARKRTKRLGRGPGSGTGKTAGRGVKGQRARRSIPIAFEGGQNPIHRRVPKRGFTNIHRHEVYSVNVGRLDRLDSDTKVTPELLHQLGLVPKKALRASKRLSPPMIKILGTGDLSKRLLVSVHQVSDSARQKIEQAGGSVELINS